ncbi:MAG: ABC transporter permease subunit, partial [Betaproteobacteria bacterium]|nr:ABC transporter permease subunit [Betaproteobacteria bacterium]
RYRFFMILVLIGILESACRMAWIDPIAVIAPSKMFQGAVSLLASGQYAEDILLTLQTVAAALVISVITGFGLGLLLFRLPRLKAAADPFLASYYAIPMFMFYPLFIVMFGLNRWPLVAIGFVFSFIAMAINTVDGLNRVPRVLMRVGQSMNLSAWQRIRFIQLPAAAPYLFTGVKLAVVYAFIGVIAGEFVLAGAGFGYRIAFAYNAFDNATMYGLLVLLIGGVGGLNLSLYRWERLIHERRGGR